MKPFLAISFVLLFLSFNACKKGPETMPATPETQASGLHHGATIKDDDDHDDDGKQGPFEKAGSEMKKGFKKAGKEIKDAFD